MPGYLKASITNIEHPISNVEIGIGIEIEPLDTTADGKFFVFSIPIPMAIPISIWMILMDNGQWTI
jgi:hypothetical protein